MDIYTESAGVFTESTGVNRRMWPYIYTKNKGVHRGTFTDISIVGKVLRGRKDTYDEYRRYKPKWDICTDALGKVQKGVDYADALQKGF